MKYGINKSNFAEFGIYLVKSRLFRLLRDRLSDDWVKYLPFVTSALNKRRLPRLGFLRPEDINSPDNDIDVRKAKEENHIKTLTEPSWRQQVENQKLYESSKSPFQKGAFVYLDDPQFVFNKSFHVQVSKLFSLFFVNAGDSLSLYYIADTSRHR